MATASALYITLARAGAPEPLPNPYAATETAMPYSTTSTPIRSDKPSRCIESAAQALPSRWQDALGDWLERLLQPCADDLRKLDDHALRDIGLTRSEIVSAQTELARLTAPTRLASAAAGA
jgi:uncharacterized protein YjiS (DUF1127 family)